MSKRRRRRFSREFKMRVIERLEAGESGTALGLELSIKRTIIYRWRDLWRHGGVAALHGKPGLGPRPRRS
jgi:transposase-like protein